MAVDEGAIQAWQDALSSKLPPEDAVRFTRAHITQLVRGEYLPKDLPRVSRQGLQEAGLPPALVDVLMTLKGVVYVHLVMGKKQHTELPQQLDADGCLSFLPLRERVEQLGHQLSGIAIVDERCEQPAYQQLLSYKYKLRDGQHVYLKADPKGGKLSFWGRVLGGLHGVHHATLLLTALSGLVHASPVRRARNMSAFFVGSYGHLHQLLGKRSVLPREQQQWREQQQREQQQRQPCDCAWYEYAC